MGQDKNGIDELLPDRNLNTAFDTESARIGAFNNENKKENARLKTQQIIELRRRKQYEDTHGGMNPTEYKNYKNNEQIKQAQEVVKKAAETQPIVVINKGEKNLSGTTRVDIAKLMTSLNINTSIQLTKADTMNLLATLLTCNENQLKALQGNNKVPIAIKIVIKRLLDDSAMGNMDALEKLWDRIFGKTLQINDPAAGDGLLNGLFTGKPVSREAYMIIRETVIGKD